MQFEIVGFNVSISTLQIVDFALQLISAYAVEQRPLFLPPPFIQFLLRLKLSLPNFRHDTIVRYDPRESTPTGTIDQRKLIGPEKMATSPKVKRATALAYDPLTTRHYNETEHHVECPERVTAVSLKRCLFYVEA